MPASYEVVHGNHLHPVTVLETFEDEDSADKYLEKILEAAPPWDQIDFWVRKAVPNPK